MNSMTWKFKDAREMSTKKMVWMTLLKENICCSIIRNTLKQETNVHWQNKWINCSIHSEKLDGRKKKNEWLIHATTWINLKDIILSRNAFPKECILPNPIYITFKVVQRIYVSTGYLCRVLTGNRYRSLLGFWKYSIFWREW